MCFLLVLFFVCYQILDVIFKLLYFGEIQENFFFFIYFISYFMIEFYEGEYGFLNMLMVEFGDYNLKLKVNSQYI